jgi:hypothetical protein
MTVHMETVYAADKNVWLHFLDSARQTMRVPWKLGCLERVHHGLYKEATGI